ncbi:FAD-binding protein [Chryseolinea sp. T2]|uniref:FAD-binding oxidoreductase n=1 Tax=Chryseolinea sp. T2 TaxID=3129255 RepID=UPI003078172A
MGTLALENPTILHVEETAWQSFASSIRGQIILRGDPTYDDERKVYNGMIDRKPGAIVKCRDVADVMTCVNFCRDNHLLVAIRGGGHNGGGLGMCDDGMVIDMSLMRGVRIDMKSNTVRAEGGALLGDLDHATQAFGKAVPSGIFSTTGVGGLTLGGGIGHLSRAYGLSIDSLLEVDIVLANGKLVTASEQENADLFWGIRGGGGNFGVVTSFLFRMHNVEGVYGGPMLWDVADSEEMMKFYRDFILNAPNEAYCYFAFLTVPPVPIFPAELHLKQMCGVVWCNIGDEKRAKELVDTFRDYKKPALDYVGPMPFNVLQTLFDALIPKGLQWYWKADFVKDLTDESIQLNFKYAKRMPTTLSTMHMYPINGAAHNRSNGDMAFAYRHANWAQVIVGVDPDPANNEKMMTWCREYYEALHPFSSGGAYVNFMMVEEQDRVRASYGENYDKLARIKSKYDPDNVFRVNQNIRL